MNYDFEDFEIETNDGYKLNLFRIKSKNLKDGAPVALFMHALLDSADAFVVNKENSPAFILASKGYDVFVGNNRGNRFSRKHRDFDPEGDADSKKRFWDFSFQEMAEEDLPALLNFITDKTKQEKLTYIGHQQGNTQMLYALADPNISPKVSKKLNLLIALSPMTRMDNMDSQFIRFFSNFQGIIGFVTDLFSSYEVFGEGAHMLGTYECKLIPEVCHLAKSFVDSSTTEYDD